MQGGLRTVCSWGVSIVAGPHLVREVLVRGSALRGPLAHALLRDQVEQRAQLPGSRRRGRRDLDARQGLHVRLEAAQHVCMCGALPHVPAPAGGDWSEARLHMRLHAHWTTRERDFFVAPLRQHPPLVQ